MAEYAAIEREYASALADAGIAMVDRVSYDEAAADLRERLREKGALLRNGGASVLAGDISPACVACTGSSDSQTFFLSLACNRDCYFCFNANQADYDESRFLKRDWMTQLDAYLDEHPHASCIGLTGGEPLLHEDEAVAFLARACERAPQAHVRLYTAGDFLGERVLERLRDAGLDELRLSVKLDALDEKEAAQRTVEKALDTLEQAKRYIPQVMVEMPVIPGTAAPMRELLRGLDAIGAFGINLLEFGFPMNAWYEFTRRGFAVLNPPYGVMYDYTYAGGVPVAGSEVLCLELLEFALDEGLSLGVHYCSLENKNRSQIRQQNEQHKLDVRLWEFDGEDFFWKRAKAFDGDAPAVRERLRQLGVPYEWDAEEGSVAFHVKHLPEVVGETMPVVSYNVVEPREGGFVVRELKLEPWGWEDAVSGQDEMTQEMWTYRAACCELLALSFRYPDEVLAEAVATGEWLDAAREIASALRVSLPDDFGAGLPSAEESAADAADGAESALADTDAVSDAADAPADAEASAGASQLLRQLRPEATRLFVGAPEPACSPYEGVWRAHADGVQALLFVNPHSMDVERFCKSCGLGRPEGTNEPLDHIATEMELLQYLASLEAGIVASAPESPAPDQLPGGSAAAAFAQFVSEHVETWVPDFAASLLEEARQPFYRAAAQLLDAARASFVDEL